MCLSRKEKKKTKKEVFSRGMRDVFLWVCFHTEVIVADFTKCNAQCSLLLVTLKNHLGKYIAKKRCEEDVMK